MDIKQGRSNFHLREFAHDAGIKECLENITGTVLVAYKQGIDTPWGIRITTCFIVYYAQDTIFTVHTVDKTTNAGGNVAYWCMYGNVFVYILFRFFECKGSISIIVLEQLFEVSDNNGRTDKLCTIVFIVGIPNFSL